METGESGALKRLYAAAQHHARKAPELALTGDEHESRDAALHAGCAIELIAKAVLVSTDTRLVAPAQGLHHVLLEAVAGGKSPGQPLVPRRGGTGKKTVDARTAVELAGRLHDELRKNEAAAVAALDARNAAAHMASCSAEDLPGVISGMASYIEAALHVLRKTSHGFWGVLASEMHDRAAARDRAVGEAAEAKISAAASLHTRLFEGLDEARRDALVRMLAPRVHDLGFGDDSWTVECPACGFNDALLGWEADYDVEPDGEGGYEAVTGGLALLGLRCPICQLDLDGDEVIALGIDTDDPRDAWDLP